MAKEQALTVLNVKKIIPVYHDFISYAQIIEALEGFNKVRGGKWKIEIKINDRLTLIDRKLSIHRPPLGLLHSRVSYLNCMFPRHVSPSDFDFTESDEQLEKCMLCAVASCQQNFYAPNCTYE
uniref:Uncharacterized protein n=1 Tax=Romanomermis culicivorax TaxID=13658 RepID=A0A915KYS6_ROMCU